MAFKEGHEKSGGRKAGTPNKASSALRDRITAFLEGEFDGVVKEYKDLPAKDKLKFYTDLMQYAVPKLAATSLELDFDNMSEEQLDEIINRLLQASKSE